jgi:hypothetical protein
MNRAILFSDGRTKRNSKLPHRVLYMIFAMALLFVIGCGNRVLHPQLDTIYNPANIQPSQVKYTGLVIDARGKGVRASLTPRILVRLDSTYQVIYGRGVCDDEVVKTHGYCAYKKTLREAYLHGERIGAEPLTIRPIQTVEPENKDVVVSREDADLIIGAFKANSFEKECKVIFVID